MSDWKSLFGIAGLAGSVVSAVGVAAIVPFIVPVVSVVGVGALVVGGGKALMKRIDEAEEKGKKSGERNAKAGYSIQVANMLKKIKKYEENNNEQKKIEELSLALFAVAYSFANCDGIIHKDEELNIQEFCSGQLYQSLPKKLRSELEKLRNHPPSFNTAMMYVKKLDRQSWSIFDDLLNIIMHSDGIINKEELAYMEAWNKYKKMAA